MKETKPIALFWFRRDLRLEDNAGLWHALKSGWPVLPVFILDTGILDNLEDRSDRRVTFIIGALNELGRKIAATGSALLVYHGTPEAVFRKILDVYRVKAVYANCDYEPYATGRDTRIASLLESRGVTFHAFKDQVIFEKSEVAKSDGRPYTVFTPYSRAWKRKLTLPDTESFPSEKLAGNFLKREDTGTSRGEMTAAGVLPQGNDPRTTGGEMTAAGVLPQGKDPRTIGMEHNPTGNTGIEEASFISGPGNSRGNMFAPENIGFITTSSESPVPVIDIEIIRNYHRTRDFPALQGTTRLGVHLRFGTVSIRNLVRTALELSETWLNELIWREFFMSILWHFPHVTDNSFKRKYDNLTWRNNEMEFERWCNGMTGYPIVDAGMRELNATGFMHNRVRMITASFLTKHLLTDWRWGEAYFAGKLLDYELSSNNGNWQWAAGTGCDAAPYFRVFNPTEQTRKFDPDLAYVRRWVPEMDTRSYPAPVVDHAAARKRALETYAAGLGRD